MLKAVLAVLGTSPIQHHSQPSCHVHPKMWRKRGCAACRLVAFLYLLGNSFWFVAVCFQMIEALNVGYDVRLYEWEASGQQGPKPRSVAAGSCQTTGWNLRCCKPKCAVCTSCAPCTVTENICLSHPHPAVCAESACIICLWPAGNAGLGCPRC